MLVKEQICTCQRTTILPSKCSAIFCQCMSVCLPPRALALQRWQPFCYQKLLSSPWWEMRECSPKEQEESLHISLHPSWRKCFEGAIWQIFFCILLCSLLYLKHIPDTSQYFLIAVLLLCDCCLLKCGKTVWTLCRKTTSSPGLNNYLWNYTDFIQI